MLVICLCSKRPQWTMMLWRYVYEGWFYEFWHLTDTQGVLNSVTETVFIVTEKLKFSFTQTNLAAKLFTSFLFFLLFLTYTWRAFSGILSLWGVRVAERRAFVLSFELFVLVLSWWRLFSQIVSLACLEWCGFHFELWLSYFEFKLLNLNNSLHK